MDSGEWEWYRAIIFPTSWKPLASPEGLLGILKLGGETEWHSKYMDRWEPLWVLSRLSLASIEPLCWFSSRQQSHFRMDQNRRFQAYSFTLLFLSTEVSGTQKRQDYTFKTQLQTRKWLPVSAVSSTLQRFPPTEGAQGQTVRQEPRAGFERVSAPARTALPALRSPVAIPGPLLWWRALVSKSVVWWQ